ncbi:hypothetical protein GLE_1087 [Lysobacter enzymogenes]|uniref:Uncharacterized protein n=1 Tax=Lysobacter enzymogenes TaxID=69 RepID=A0A0S2DDR1_LYSEN|nr:hypothetical protein GLE_1087 [Lysobacter enzymogenes]
MVATPVSRGQASAAPTAAASADGHPDLRHRAAVRVGSRKRPRISPSRVPSGIALEQASRDSATWATNPARRIAPRRPRR